MSLKGFKMCILAIAAKISAGLLSFVVARPYECYSKCYSSEENSVEAREMRDTKYTYFLLLD